jgi:FAD/FMN-containing dehydrogenase
LLERALGPSKVVTDADACRSYAGDESEQEPVLPDAVVLASTSEDIQKALAVATEAGVPIVPRAGGSGKSGGAVPVCGGIVVSTIGMRQIKEIDRAEQIAVVEPGVILADLHAAVEAGERPASGAGALPLAEPKASGTRAGDHGGRARAAQPRCREAWRTGRGQPPANVRPA